MMTTAAAVAVVLMALGELLRTLHFTIGSLSIAGGVILLVLAVWMVLGPAADNSHRSADKDGLPRKIGPTPQDGSGSVVARRANVRCRCCRPAASMTVPCER